jgi:hypothetical protein
VQVGDPLFSTHVPLSRYSPISGRKPCASTPALPLVACYLRDLFLPLVVLRKIFLFVIESVLHPVSTMLPGFMPWQLTKVHYVDVPLRHSSTWYLRLVYFRWRFTKWMSFCSTVLFSTSDWLYLRWRFTKLGCLLCLVPPWRLFNGSRIFRCTVIYCAFQISDVTRKHMYVPLTTSEYPIQ